MRTDSKMYMSAKADPNLAGKTRKRVLTQHFINAWQLAYEWDSLWKRIFLRIRS